ncbi:hypothetical protein GGI07_005833 [Coemansia sp. Benny D115]|nr:hypothetical protein GGI07_005833 [Coemansia sp. Benny D115]
MNLGSLLSQPSAQTQTPDFYDVLRCSPRSTKDEIHKEYRRLALQHHPDKTNDTARWDEIRQAYDILGNEQKRAQYDRWRMSKLPVAFGEWVRSQAHAVHWKFDYQRAIQSDQKKWWDDRTRKESSHGDDIYAKFRNYEI